MNNDPLRIFESGFSDINDARCECGDLFSDHEKPPDGTPWDICSFPCSKCKCQEFTAAATAAPVEQKVDEILSTNEQWIRNITPHD